MSNLIHTQLVGLVYESDEIEVMSTIFNFSISLAAAGTVKVFISDTKGGTYTECTDVDQYVLDNYSMNIIDAVSNQWMKIVATTEITRLAIQWDGNYWKEIE